MRNFFQTQRPAFLPALFLISLLALLFSLLQSSPTNAQAVIPLTETLSVVSPDGSQNISVAEGSGSDWRTIISEYNYSAYGSCSSSFQDELRTNITNYPIAWRTVSQVSTPTNETLGVYIVYNNVSNTGAVLSNLGDETGFYLSPYNNGTGQPYVALLTVDNSGTFRLDCRNNSGNAYSMQGIDQPGSVYMSMSGFYSGYGGAFAWLYYSNFPIVENWTTQPTPDLPGEPPSEVEENDAQPDIFMSSMSEFKGEFSDRKFFTFDGIPFTCGEFVPQLNVEVWTTHGEPEEELLDSLSTTASSQFTYTFPTSTNTQDYRIVSWYSCPEFTFSNVSFYDFQINSSGGLVAAIPCNAELFCDLNLPTYGLTQALLSPLAFVSQLPTNNCSSLNLPLPNDIGNITMPCMTPIYQQYFGPILLIYQTILTGLFAYYVSIKLFGNVKALTNPKDDQVETVKL